jgi:hypothetical protein
VRAKKDRRIPVPEELPRILDDKFIRDLAQQAKLPLDADIPRFAAEIRHAALRYVAVMTITSDRAMRDEIQALYSAAVRHRYKETATRIDKLSEQTRAFLKRRGDRRSVGLAIPEPEVLKDFGRRDQACETIVRLLRVGMKGGKAILHAPTPHPRPPRRKAELDLVMWLRVAYLDATGMPPTHTANPNRPGPFARMVQTCLDKIAPGTNAAEMLNELHRRRKLKLGTAPKT